MSEETPKTFSENWQRKNEGRKTLHIEANFSDCK